MKLMRLASSVALATALSLAASISPIVNAVASAVSAPDLDASVGTIEGSLSYPGESIPALKICAENISTQARYCTQTQIQDAKYAHGKGYRLQLPAGTYRVFATAQQHTAHYSVAVPCGLTVKCQDHRQVAVTVKAGQTLSGVDPTDWFWPLSSPTVPGVVAAEEVLLHTARSK
jgi:hypothetical protein